jgi:hypothetical protein
MARSQNQESRDDSKGAQVRRHCRIPEAFGNAMSHPGLRFTVFTEDIRESEPTFRDIQTDESTVPWSKAA